MRHRNHWPTLLLKGWGSLSLALIILVATLPYLFSLQTREWMDQGKRSLIIIATEGGNRGYTTHVNSKVETDGSYSFSFYLVTEDKRSDGDSRFKVNYQVIILDGRNSTNIRCGGEETRNEEISVTDLDPGPRHAYDTDLASTAASALDPKNSASETSPVEALGGNQENAHDAPMNDPSGPEDERTAFRAMGSVWTWHGDERPSRKKRSVNENGAVFVEHCSISPESIWMSDAARNPLKSAQSTLLLPQFNLTSRSEKTDYQKNLQVQVHVARTQGLRIEEAYPEPRTEALGWELDYSVYRQKELGKVGNLLYTDQPTWLLRNRNTDRAEQTFILFAGIVIGLALTLAVEGLRDLVDSSSLRRSKVNSSP